MQECTYASTVCTNVFKDKASFGQRHFADIFLVVSLTRSFLGVDVVAPIDLLLLTLQLVLLWSS